MKAMVFAAGVGSRLGKYTQDRPKCLLQIGERPILGHVVERLKAAGVRAIVINLHHYPDQIRSYIESEEKFGIQIDFTFEESLLDTGGGLLNAREHFEDEEVFVIHNADIYSEIDLAHMIGHHRDQSAVATLATLVTDAPRRLLFNAEDHLVGWENVTDGKKRMAVAESNPVIYGFCGIAVASSDLFEYMEGRGRRFSIIDSYLAAAGAGKIVSACAVDTAYWIDIGTPEDLERVRQQYGA